MTSRFTIPFLFRFLSVLLCILPSRFLLCFLFFPGSLSPVTLYFSRLLHFPPSVTLTSIATANMSLIQTNKASSPDPPSAGSSPPANPAIAGPPMIPLTVPVPTSELNNVIEPSNEPGEYFDDGDSALGSDAGSSTGSITSSIMHYRTVNGRTYHNDRTSAQYWGANDDAQNSSVDIMCVYPGKVTVPSVCVSFS